MAQIDLREATIKIWDGTLPTLVTDDTYLTFEAISRHMCSRRISITLIDPETVAAETTVSVDGYDIEITLANTTGSAISATSGDVVDAIEASDDASALVTAEAASAGTDVVAAQEITYLEGQNSLTVKVGDGNLSYTSHRKVEFTLDRGEIDTCRTAPDDPMDIQLDFTWEWLTSESGAITPTFEEAIKKKGPAVSWLTSATDQCQPYCVDVEVLNAPACAEFANELIILEEYYYESLDHDLKKGTVSTKGRCNRRKASVYRYTPPVIS
jgi:hypothetical protein